MTNVRTLGAVLTLMLALPSLACDASDNAMGGPIGSSGSGGSSVPDGSIDSESASADGGADTAGLAESDAPVADAPSETPGETGGDAPPTNISFALPAKSYVFDAAAWHLPTGAFPAIPCGDGQMVTDCCNPPPPTPRPDCSVNAMSCDSAVCALHVAVSVSQAMDLKREVPGLSSLGDQSLVDVAIKQIRYVYVSTLTVDLPPVTFFVAPDGVTASSLPANRRFGTTKTVPAGSTGDDTIDLGPAGGAAFAEIAHHWGMPFNFIADTAVVIPSGSPIPSGRVTLVVQGIATADF